MPNPSLYSRGYIDSLAILILRRGLEKVGVRGYTRLIGVGVGDLYINILSSILAYFIGLKKIEA